MKHKSESGQALIELIIFLPLMFMVYSLISGFASAINGSINQQKITRSYFYYRVQHNSTTPKPDHSSPTHQNWNKFGMFFIGWKEKFASGSVPQMPCYRVSIPMKAENTDKCEEAYSRETTQFIRVATVYGFCGATYEKEGNGVVMLPNGSGRSYQSVVDRDSCLIR